MEQLEESRDDLLRRLRSSRAVSSSSPPQQHQHLSPPPHNPFTNSFDLPDVNPPRAPLRCASSGGGSTNSSGSKRPAGFPPSHPTVPPTSPYFQIPNPARSPAQQPSPQSSGHGHTRSFSQPASFFSLDSLPPLSPPSASVLSDPASTDVLMEDRDSSSPVTATTLPPGPFSRSKSGRAAGGFPPQKAHRRSISEVPLGFTFSQSSFPLVVPPLAQRPPRGLLEPSASAGDDLNSAGKKSQGQLLRKEWNWDRGLDKSAEGMGGGKSEGDSGDDLLEEYMNLAGQDGLNSSGTEEKQEDLDSRASGSRTNGAADCSENEAESSVSEGVTSFQQLKVNVSPSFEKKEGIKRSAVGDPVPNINRSRHVRSVSIDSFMGKMNFEDELPKLPPSPAIKAGQHSHNKSLDGASNAFGLELGNGDFSGTELQKLMADEKLADIALTDPKRAKRILANRQSAAHSKERKLRYISELEHKVQTLQTEATTLSTQLTKLQRDSAGLTNQNHELKFRLQAMVQQAQLRNALNEALTAEVQRMKLATQGLAEANTSSDLTQQLPVNPRLFPLHQLRQQQPSQLHIYQLQQLQPPQQVLPQQQQQSQMQNQQLRQENSLEVKTRNEPVT